MNEYLVECLEYAKKENINTVNKAKIRFYEILRNSSIRDRVEFYKEIEKTIAQ